MPRPRNTDRPSRARQPLDVQPVLVRPGDFTRLVGLTEGHARQIEARDPAAPRPIKVGRAVLRDVTAWVTYLRNLPAAA